MSPPGHDSGAAALTAGGECVDWLLLLFFFFLPLLLSKVCQVKNGQESNGSGAVELQLIGLLQPRRHLLGDTIEHVRPEGKKPFLGLGLQYTRE